MVRRPDPLTIPGTNRRAEDCLACSLPLPGTPGQAYAEKRGIAATTAHAAGLRYIADFAGRPAVVIALYDDKDALASVHGRYLDVRRSQDKMLTVGPGGGTINVLGGWRADPLIIVEGLFDALSLAGSGFASVATIGRWVPWLPHVAVGRGIWLAFDRSRSGEAEAVRYSAHMSACDVRRMWPPGRSKDWNTALLKYGAGTIARRVSECVRGTK